MIRLLDDKISKMIEENIKLVPYIVHTKFKGDITRNPDLLDEYIGVGNLALIDACKKFDESKGYQFATYATTIIWGEIQKFRRDKRNSIKLPRRLHKAATEYGRGRALNKDIDTICEETGIKKEDIEEWLNVKGVANLDTPIRDPKDEGSNTTMLDMLADDFDVEDCVIEDMKYKEKMEILEKILKPQELEIVKLIESGIYRQNEIADIIGISQSYVSRIIRKLTEEVGPNLEKYHSGEISLQEFCKRLKIKEDVFMNFDKEVNIACQWLIDNPGKELNLAKVLKEAGANVSTYYRTRIKDKALKKMLEDGYAIQEVPYASGGTRLKLYKPGQEKGSNNKKVEENINITRKRETSELQSKDLNDSLKFEGEPRDIIEENILLNILDIPVENCDLEFTEALQKSLSMFTMLGKAAVLDIRVREVG